MDILLLLSGPTAVGKTSISEKLVESLGFSRLATSPYLKRLAATRSLPATKSTLQTIGDELDEQTDFAWVESLVARPSFEQNPAIARWLIDSVRKPQQVIAFRAGFGLRVCHIHLTAPAGVLKQRYEMRTRRDEHIVNDTPYEDVIGHPNEISARSLISVADLVYDVAKLSDEQIVEDVLNECQKRGGARWAGSY